jgi:hypothetical protein
MNGNKRSLYPLCLSVLLLAMFDFAAAFALYALSTNYSHVFPIQALEG